MSRIADVVRLGREIKTARIGYSREMSGPNSRWSWLDLAHRVIVPGMSGDCSSIVLGLYVLAGYPVDISGLCYTGNAAALTRAAGFSVTRFSGRLSDLRPGDALVEPGRHIVLILDGGECLSPETNELGRATGGRAGDQTGREVRIRPVYLRDASRADGGWTYLLRPPYEPGSVDVPAVVPSLSIITTTAPAKPGPLRIDGTFGPQTARRLQAIIGAAVDGQWGPESRRKMQAWLGVKVDGTVGPVTVKALQRRVGASPDGEWGPLTTKALQRYLNAQNLTRSVPV